MSTSSALPSSKIQASEYALSDIFNAKFNFSIPDYQRPYSWTTEQASELLSDIQEAADRNPDEPYFLGSIVLVKPAEAANAEVIDGQQRLTTLTILLAMLRESTTNSELGTSLQAFVVEPGNIALGLAAKPRLKLRNKDAEFFENYIQKPGHADVLKILQEESLATDAQRAIIGNAKYFMNELAKLSQDQLLSLSTQLLSKTFLVVVSTADLASAHRIFSVMNARGLDLTPADLFKAELIGRVAEEKRQSYAEKWENSEEELGRHGFSELFLHVRMIFAKVRGQRELLFEFKEQVLEPYLKEQDATTFIDDVLVPYAKAFGVLTDASFSASHGADRVNAWLTRLGMLDNSDWVPSALWALRTHGNDPEWLNVFFFKLERLAASLLIRRVYSTPRAMRYVELLKELDRGLGLDATAFTLDTSEQAETVDGLAGNIYLSQRVVRYVLLRLDESLAGSSGVTYAQKYISVEHVLPQTPKSDSAWLADFTEEERDYWTHKLGNLLLLNKAKNSQASNRDFAIKKQGYFIGKYGVSNYAITTQVLQHDEWTPAVIEALHQERLESLAAMWQLETQLI